MATDAFGRLRISNPYTIFDYYPPNTNSIHVSDVSIDSDVWVTTETGTTSYTGGDSKVTLECSTNNSKITRETKLPMEYQPGKSRLIYMSSVPLSRVNDGSETFEFNVGIFSVDDSTKNPFEGHYLKTDGTNIYFVETYNSSENSIVQSSWNIDTFDGNGPSGKTIDINSMTKNILIVIDQEWLGVGRVRVGFNIDGINYYAHEFLHNNTYPYTSTPRLPLVYQLSTTNINSTIQAYQICSTCISEGGYAPTGRKNSIFTDTTGSGSTPIILAGLRLKPSYKTGIIKLLGLDVAQTSNSLTHVQLQLHSSTNFTYGTTSLTSTWVDVNNSAIQYLEGDGVNDTLTTDGFVIGNYIVEQKANISISTTIFETLLTRNQVTKYDTLYVVARDNINTNDFKVTIEFIESY